MPRFSFPGSPELTDGLSQSCANVLTKKKLDPHRKQCPSAQFTCLDCHVTFKGLDYRSHSVSSPFHESGTRSPPSLSFDASHRASHSSILVIFDANHTRANQNCITEAQKTQGPFYKPKKAKIEQRKSTTTASQSQALVPRNAVPKETPETPDTRLAVVDAPPRAPSPPPPSKSLPVPPEVNVFDFLVTDGKDGPSQVNTPKDDEFMTDEDNDDEQWEDEDDVFMDPPPDYYAKTTYNAQRDFDERGYSYGAEPIRQSLQRYVSTPHLPTNVMAYLVSHDDDDDADTDADDALKTPAPNYASTAAKSHHERTVSGDSTTKKSGKRKRSQPEDLDLSRIRAYTAPGGDVIMTDVPTPSLHSGLTVGLSRMMMARSAAGGFPFPPSPDDSIGDLEGEERGGLEPRSPLKRTKHSGSKERGRSREKGREKSHREREHRRAKKSRRESDQSRKHGRWERRRPRGRSQSPLKEKEPTSLLGKALKAIDYYPVSSTGARAARDEPRPHDGNAVILYPSAATSRAETFMSFVAGSSLVENSERGCSVNKALRRWHREKGSTSKAQEEKELWRDLRLRVNDRGEIVLFAD